MCGSKYAVAASLPVRRPFSASISPSLDRGVVPPYSNSASSSATTNIASSSTLSVRELLPESPLLYSPSEISPTADNFRCTLRGREVVVLRRTFRGDPQHLPARLSSVASRGYHGRLARLLGASLPSPDTLLLVYERVRGSTLAACLRAARGFTPLSSWASRIQIAADVAQALEYVHHHALSVHGHVDPSSVVVADPDLRARLCLFGAAELADGPGARLDGTRGYIAPEVRAGGAPSQGSDVYAFGVLLLELVSGDEAVRCSLEAGRLVVSSLVEAAREVLVSGEGALRRWVDQRLRDSFPVDVVERVVRIAVECVADDNQRRPDMAKVAAKLSGLLFRSREWAAGLSLPTEISVSCAPR